MTSNSDHSSLEHVPEAKNAFVSGDLFEGLIVSEYADTKYSVDIGGVHADITQRVSRPKPDRICLGFLFITEKPIRFRLDVLIPSECINAEVSLNDQQLIGFFSKDIPEDPEFVITPQCGGEEKISTLRPGAFQSLNFRWESGDVLKFFFYFPKNSASSYTESFPQQ
jgi:hypothetical protein